MTTNTINLLHFVRSRLQYGTFAPTVNAKIKLLVIVKPALHKNVHPLHDVLGYV